jgi:hypothetical protein
MSAEVEHILKLLYSVDEPEMAQEVANMHNRLEAFSQALHQVVLETQIKALREMLVASLNREKLYMEIITQVGFLHIPDVDIIIKQASKIGSQRDELIEHDAIQLELLAMETVCPACADKLYKLAIETRKEKKGETIGQHVQTKRSDGM